eukprot:403347080
MICKNDNFEENFRQIVIFLDQFCIVYYCQGYQRLYAVCKAIRTFFKEPTRERFKTLSVHDQVDITPYDDFEWASNEFGMTIDSRQQYDLSEFIQNDYSIFGNIHKINNGLNKIRPSFASLIQNEIQKIGPKLDQDYMHFQNQM